jgi:pimeloyl-ACP methyl ester carboxylesterase
MLEGLDLGHVMSCEAAGRLPHAEVVEVAVAGHQFLIEEPHPLLERVV